MKLMLSSAGFWTDEIVAELEKLVDKDRKDINIAIINEGYAVEHGDHTWVIDEFNRIRHNVGGSVELINLLTLDLNKALERIKHADVLYVVGGHTDYLMSVFNKSGFTNELPNLLEEIVYVGSSAGSMILGNRVSSDAYQEIYGEGVAYETGSYMNLVDFAIKPHMNSPGWPKNTPQQLAEVCKNYKGTVYGISDDTTIIIYGDEIRLIGSKPAKIVDGLLDV